MTEPEIILNLWYVHDDMGLIYSLRARTYVGMGTDDQKLALLHSFANLDYLIARPSPIPDRFHLEIEENGERKRIGRNRPSALQPERLEQISPGQRPGSHKAKGCQP